MDKIIKIIAEELNIKPTQVENTIKLIDEGNTIPFIARYRKEVTGGLSDEILRTFGERLNYLRNLEKRKEEVTNSINGFKGNMIFASHDHQLMQTVANRIIDIKKDGTVIDKECTYNEYLGLE